MTIQLNNVTEIKKEMKTQDNCGTATPVFILFEGEEVPTDSDYSDEYYFYNHDEQSKFKDEQEVLDDMIENKVFDNDSDEKKELQQYIKDEEWYSFSSHDSVIDCGYNKIHYLMKFTFKQFFFTKKSAEAYLKENSHHFWHPRIVCESLWRNEEMKTIRNLLLEE